MKLRNKKTGEIRELPDGFFCGNNLKKICEEWEDYEEPKEYGLDDIIILVEAYSTHDSKMYPKEIIEKLKAWKRLKDKGVEFYGWRRNHTGTYDLLVRWKDRIPRSYEVKNDLDLLFGGNDESSN